MCIETSTLSDYKDLFKVNKEFDGLKTFIRSYIKDILEGKKITKIEKEEFNLMKLYIENIKEYKEVKEENEAGIILQVDKLNDINKINKKLLEELKNKHWWLSDYFRGKELIEKFTIHTAFGNKEIFNFSSKLTKQNLKEIVEVFNLFESLKNKEPLNNIQYIIFDDKDKKNPNDQTIQNGESNYFKKYIRFFPNAFNYKTHRIGNFSNFKGTLIHEISHNFSPDTISKFKAKFWKELEEGIKVGIHTQYEIPIEGIKCISEYAKTNSKEDLSESMVGYFMDKNLLDNKKYNFIYEEIAGETKVNNGVIIKKNNDLSFPSIDNTTYFIKKKKRKKFKIN